MPSLAKRPGPRPLAIALLLLSAASVSACGGGAPLLHPANVLKPGDITVGAGLSGQPVLKALPSPTSTGSSTTNSAAEIQQRTVAPSLAPWVSARIGLAGSNEAGVTYTGRTARLDGRHAFTLSKHVSLSAGLGAEAILSGRHKTGDYFSTAFWGGGLDVPLLIGWTSTGGLYSGWIGPRVGISWIKINVWPDAQFLPPRDLLDLSAQHTQAGLVAGFRVGFRHVHVALELSAAFHHVTGRFENVDVSFNQITLGPGGALQLSF